MHTAQVALPGKNYQGCAVEKGVSHASDQIRRAWSERSQADSGATGEATIDVGHVRARLLVPHGNEGNRGISRSEEHTSELQSPCNLVCRLLLEKKKTA